MDSEHGVCLDPANRDRKAHIRIGGICDLTAVSRLIGASLVGGVCSILVWFLPRTMDQWTLLFWFIAAVSLAVVGCYRGQWLVALAIAFYIMPVLFLVTPLSVLKVVFSVQSMGDLIASQAAELRFLFSLGLSSLVPIIAILMTDRSWASLDLGGNSIPFNIVGIVAVSLTTVVVLLLALPPGRTSIFVSGYGMAEYHATMGTLIVASMILVGLLVVRNPTSPVVWMVVSFVIVWTAMLGRRVETAGLLLLIGYRAFLALGMSKRWGAMKRGLFVALAPSLSVMAFGMFNYWNKVRERGALFVEFDFSWLWKIPTAPAILHSAAALVAVVERGLVPTGSMFATYLIRFFGGSAIDISEWTQRHTTTLGGMHIALEPFAYYGVPGIVLSSVFIALLLSLPRIFRGRAFGFVLTIGLIIFLPRIFWYGYIFALRAIQVSALVSFLGIFSALLRRSGLSMAKVKKGSLRTNGLWHS